MKGKEKMKTKILSCIVLLLSALLIFCIIEIRYQKNIVNISKKCDLITDTKGNIYITNCQYYNNN